jgi:hypothetical protein
MRHKGLCRILGMPAVALLATLLLTATAGAADHRRVIMYDDCDPATFNAAVGDGTCVGEGETAFGDFIGQLAAQGSADGWFFSRDRFNIDSGGTIDVVNEGGEFHTFTKVAHFGGGCVPALNAVLGLTPVPECGGVTVPEIPAEFAASGVPPGVTRPFNVTGRGTQLYQCLIHPWMRSVVDVRKKG